MKILAIETSCDETAISVVDGSGEITNPSFSVLSHLISSQVELHAKWGGVVPALAKREHAKNIIPLLDQALTESGLKKEGQTNITDKQKKEIAEIFTHEENLPEELVKFAEGITIPDIDAIAVTYGPGLEPALWVGVNLAKALEIIWQKKLVPINHMEGHIASPLLGNDERVEFPALALLVSGGHTELVLCEDWFDYKIIGQTRDDAVGEAFDKVARILDLPYPGGPQISTLALKAKPGGSIKLPRPMLHSDDYDFSFSGLKTAVLYAVRDKDLSENDKAEMAREFQEAVVEVLLKKTFKAISNYDIKSLIIGGGVIANEALRAGILKERDSNFTQLKIFLPESPVITDNATMIAIAAYLRLKAHQEKSSENLRAIGNLRIDQV